MQGTLHKKLFDELAARINSGDLGPGDRLPAERQLAEDHGVARSVVRQALAGLARDGLAAPSYPLGYHVLGPRIPWLPRLRPLADEPWHLEQSDTTQATASDRDAATLHITAGDLVVVRPFQLRGRASGEPWATGIATHPLHRFNDAASDLLLSHDFIDDDTLERVAQRRIIGYHERVAARTHRRRTTRPPAADTRRRARDHPRHPDHHHPPRQPLACCPTRPRRSRLPHRQLSRPAPPTSAPTAARDRRQRDHDLDGVNRSAGSSAPSASWSVDEPTAGGARRVCA